MWNLLFHSTIYTISSFTISVHSLGTFVAIPAIYPSRKFTVSLPHTGQKAVKSLQWRLHLGLEQRLLPNSYPHAQHVSHSAISLWQTGHITLSFLSILFIPLILCSGSVAFILLKSPAVYSCLPCIVQPPPCPSYEPTYLVPEQSGNGRAPGCVPDNRS